MLNVSVFVEFNGIPYLTNPETDPEQFIADFNRWQYELYLNNR